MKSAIDWELVTRAKRVQEKLTRYFELLEEVKRLEGDPEVRAFLASGEAVPQPGPETTPAANALEPAHTAATVEVQGATPTVASPAALPPPAGANPPSSPPRQPVRIERHQILRALLKLDDVEEFDAQDVLGKFKEIYTLPRYANVEAKQINDHLRRMEQANLLARTKEGRRGQRGSLPRYKRIRKEVAQSPGA